MEILIALGLGAIVLVVVMLAMLIIIAKFRVVPETDEAVVITGTTVKDKVLDETGKPTGEVRQRPKVVVGGGAYVIPILHKYKIVSLEVVQIPIEWKDAGGKTLPSQDRIPVVLEGELSVMVDGSNEDQVILASQKLGIPQTGARRKQEFSMQDAVKQKADKLVQAALRTAVFEFEFVDLNAKKEEFENRVQELLQKDLARFGLTLTAVSIPHVAQGQFGASEGDMFDEQGKRKVAEIVEHAQTEKNDIEQENRIARARRNREAREQELQIQREVKEKEADQTREVAAYEANQARQQTEAVLKEQQAEEEAKAAQERAIAEAKAKEAEVAEKAEIAKLEAVAIRQAAAKASQKEAEEKAAADIAKAEADRKVVEEQAEQKKQEADIAKDKAVKVASEQRQQAIEEAEVERQKAVAQRRAEEAAARAAQAEAEAEQRKAEESVITVKETAEADRRRQVVVIKAEEEAKKDKVEADKNAYVAAKIAEGENEAAKQRAAAAKAKAKGEADAIREAAQGYADDVKFRADADAEAADKQAAAKIKLAEAMLKEGEAKAESERLLVEARNQVDNRLLLRDVALAAIAASPDLVREFMSPIGQVAHDVKILQVSGLGADGEGVQGLPATILNTGLAAAGMKPFLTDALKTVAEDPEVKETANLLSGVVRGALREATAGVREGLEGDNGLGDTGKAK